MSFFASSVACQPDVDPRCEGNISVARCEGNTAVRCLASESHVMYFEEPCRGSDRCTEALGTVFCTRQQADCTTANAGRLGDDTPLACSPSLDAEGRCLLLFDGPAWAVWHYCGGNSCSPQDAYSCHQE